MGCFLTLLATSLLLSWLLVETLGRKSSLSPSLLLSAGGKTGRSMPKKGNKAAPRKPVSKGKRRKRIEHDTGVESGSSGDDTVPLHTDERLATKATTVQIQESSSSSGIQQASTSFNVTCLTWNMAELSPTEDDCSFMRSFRTSDMVVLGVQECEDIKPRRHEGSRSRKWKALQLATLGNTFEVLAQHKIGGMQLAVYAKKKLANRITGVLVLDVACGIGNMINNKGAICALLRMKNSKTIAVVNAHLAAHSDKVKERNADYARITQAIISKAPINWLKKGTSTLAARKLIAKSMHNQKEGSSLHDNKDEKNKGIGKSRKAKGRGKGKGNRKGKRKRVIEGSMEIVNSKSGVIHNFFSNPLEKVLTAAGIPPDQESMTPAMRKEEQLRRAAASHIKGASSHWPFDATIFMGDLNYRLDLPRLEVEMLKCKIESESASDGTYSLKKSADLVDCVGLVDESNTKYFENLQDILCRDQLYKERQGRRVFPGFEEGKIRFLPTFKYDRRANSFDSSAKMRSPAWCDRILYHVNTEGTSTKIDDTDADSEATKATPVMLRDYYSIDATHSDHRPVCAKFTCDFS